MAEGRPKKKLSAEVEESGADRVSVDPSAPLIPHEKKKKKKEATSVGSGGEEKMEMVDKDKVAKKKSKKKELVSEDGSEGTHSANQVQDEVVENRKSDEKAASAKAKPVGQTTESPAPTQIGKLRSSDGGKESSWPTRLQLTQMLEERTLAHLEQLGGTMGLCERLGVAPQQGLDHPVSDWNERTTMFGENKFEEKKLTPFYKFVYEQLAQKIIILLLSMATFEIIIKSIVGTDRERVEAIGESSMLYFTVFIIVMIAATLDWKRERMFEQMQKLMAATNIRFIIRGGKQLEVTDDKICVGDIMSFNSHMAAIISCDGVFISGRDVKADESALTGEPEPIPKDNERPFLISGSTVCAGSGTMLVVAVGEYSIAGKIKKDVYAGEAAEPSPLYAKLDVMANNIGKAGSLGAFIAMVALFTNEFGVKQSGNWKAIIDILLTTLGVLACAIPEGLPLALIIALALTSSKMTKDNNLVKSLTSCETMGSATTICTDKTGTLTTNRMTVRGAYISGVLVPPKGTLSAGPQVALDNRISQAVKTLLGNLMCCCTMDESGFFYPDTPSGPSTIAQFQGNPTECALLKMAEEMSFDYRLIRKETVGRSPDTLDQGCAKSFTSARKLMSWTVKKPDGGYRVYAKGASEIVLSRATMINMRGEVKSLGSDEISEINGTISDFADMAMRTIGLAYKDISKMTYDELDSSVLNSDGSEAFSCEVGLTMLAVVGIEDPLRAEVAPAIQRCYRAGIDVRMVTGDNLQTAIAIAKGAGILSLDLHCDSTGCPLPKRAMEGKTFRQYVHECNSLGEATFIQAKFDEVWPYLRVLARSSPDDKLTLAKGLNSSLIYQDVTKCKELLDNDRIVIFPDRQVVAMTGDGTNDAPALKASDVGFAMGIAGTQIAKDAANIILLDDNFASIVIAAKWGRNVYDSIQKFLQFQLAANASILLLNIFCSIADVPSPMTVLHLLWLNLIMDSFASIAFASEPATDDLLERPPVNRSRSILTKRMLCNIIGSAAYNLTMVIFLLLVYEWIPSLTVYSDDPITGPKSRHYTMLFNIFIFLQTFNQYNSRFLYDTWKLWKGLDKNPVYVGLSIAIISFQVIMVQLAAPILTHALKVHPNGLTFLQWVLCIVVGLGSIVNQMLMNGIRHVWEIHQKKKLQQGR